MILFAGLVPAIVGSGIAWGTYFTTYNRAKDRYRRGDSYLGSTGPIVHLASAAEAGILVCLMTNPIWVVKTRLQLQEKGVKFQPSVGPQDCASHTQMKMKMSRGRGPFKGGSPARDVSLRLQPNNRYKGFLDCLIQVFQTEGFRGLYKGLLPSLFLVSHGAIQFAAYEELKGASFHIRHHLRSFRSESQNMHDELTPVEISACGALSKVVASAATYPSQVVRSRLQQRMDARTIRYDGIVDVVKKTMRREGIRGFYKGIFPNVLRVMPQSALTFLVYETVFRVLNDFT